VTFTAIVAVSNNLDKGIGNMIVSAFSGFGLFDYIYRPVRVHFRDHIKWSLRHYDRRFRGVQFFPFSRSDIYNVVKRYLLLGFE
jgi:hypothetical protein